MSENSYPNEFKILIASDCHLGYNEKHSIRGDDSFRTFEEILQASQKENVDFILLAGDLFHLNRPSTQTLLRAMSLIRKYCFGGDGHQRFIMKNFKNANYLDPNIKIKHPIFTIHGNHDDPIGVERTCCLDLLSTSGLINYFGKQDNVEQLLLKPIIFEKGSTKIMLFGFGSMREERLNHLIQTEVFHYMIPDFSEENHEDEELKKFFKILLIHQNRIPRPNIKHVNPYDLGDIPDMVVWGHEHQPFEGFFEQKKFFILQPGSTVATSLCQSEQGDKFYYILNCYYDEIKKKPRFKIKRHLCKTVRPFLISTVDVDAILAKKSFKSLIEQQQFFYSFCKNQVNSMIKNLGQSLLENKPLIRLRIEYSNKDQLFDKRLFESDLNLVVANTDDIIRFVKKRLANSKIYDDEPVDYGFIEMIDSIDYEATMKRIHVKSVMEQHFASASDKQKLSLYDESFFTEKLLEFVDKNQLDVFQDFFENTKQVIRGILLNEPDLIEEEDLRDHVLSVKRKIEQDKEFRQKICWISKEPFIKRTVQQLRQKISMPSFDEICEPQILGKCEVDDEFYKDAIDTMSESLSVKTKDNFKRLQSKRIKTKPENNMNNPDTQDESKVIISRTKRKAIDLDDDFNDNNSQSKSTQEDSEDFDFDKMDHEDYVNFINKYCSSNNITEQSSTQSPNIHENENDNDMIEYCKPVDKISKNIKDLSQDEIQNIKKIVSPKSRQISDYFQKKLI